MSEGESLAGGTDGVAQAEVSALVEDRLGEVPVPASVGGCLSAVLTQDADLVRVWEAAEPGEVPDGVLSAATRCLEVERALPVFVEALEEQVSGGLSAEQRACVDAGYVSLPPEVLDAARDEVPGGGGKGVRRRRLD